MKLIRLLSLLLLATTLSAQAVPTFSMSETWNEVLVTNPVTHTTSIVTNGAASLVFSGIVMTNVGPIGFDTFFDIGGAGAALYGDLWGMPNDDNPIISSYTPGATSATFKFYHNTPNTNGNPHYAVVKTLTLSWAHNVLSGTATGRSGALGLEHMATSTNYTYPPVGGISAFVAFGKYERIIDCVYHLSNKVNTPASSPVPLNSGSCTVVGDFLPATLTITSPAPHQATNTPSIEVTGTITDNLATFAPVWRLAAPGDDPSLGVSAFNGWLYAIENTPDFPKQSTWTTGFNIVNLVPGTNWFWVSGFDLCQNVSSIVTRRIFYSVRSPLTLLTSGNGTVIGSRGVRDGAMLEVGRGYTVAGKPKDTNTVFRDWRDGDFKVLSTLNPWNFLMQSNMTIVGNFVTNPFPAIAGTYSGPFFDTFRPPLHNNPSSANSGYTIITVKPDGTYTGTVLFRAGRFPIAGKLRFDADFEDPDAVNSTFATGADRSLSGNIRFPSDGSGHLLPTPTLSMTISSLILSPMPLVQSSTNAVAPGLYNFVDDVANLSVGASYGSVVVTPKGQANVVMHLADGSPAVTFSTPVRKDHSIAIFIPLNGGDGMILATLNLEFLFPLSASGGRWVKPPNASAKVYPAGVVENLDLVIGRYTPDIGKSILTNFAVGEIMIANDTISYSAQFIYSPANNRIVAMPGQSNVTMNLTFDPATGLVAGTITFAGHNPFHVNALIGGENIGYTLDTDHSVLIVLRATPLASLGTYDDGFVLADESSIDAELGATAFFSFQDAWQLVTTPVLPPPPPSPSPSLRDVLIGPPTIGVQVLMRRDIQIAPHQHFIVTDTFDSMDVRNPGLYPELPSVGPYTGPINPEDYAAPAVTITPTHRATQYITN